MSAELEQLLEAARFLVTRHKPGLTPTAHLPHPDDPESPKCGKRSRTGKGFKPYPAELVESEQICGSCLERDRKGGGPTPTYEWLEEAEPEAIGGAWP